MKFMKVGLCKNCCRWSFAVLLLSPSIFPLLSWWGDVHHPLGRPAAWFWAALGGGFLFVGILENGIGNKGPVWVIGPRRRQDRHIDLCRSLSNPVDFGQDTVQYVLVAMLWTLY